MNLGEVGVRRILGDFRASRPSVDRNPPVVGGDESSVCELLSRNLYGPFAVSEGLVNWCVTDIARVS